MDFTDITHGRKEMILNGRFVYEESEEFKSSAVGMLMGMGMGTHLDCLLGLYWTGLTLLNGFSFLVNFFSFLFWVVR